MYQPSKGGVAASRAIAVSLSLTLAACGGGGSDSPSTPAAPVQQTPAPVVTPPVTTTTPPVTTTTPPTTTTTDPAPTTPTTTTPATPVPYDAGVASLKALASFPIGVAVDGAGEGRDLTKTAAQQTVVKRHFSQITAGNIMKMKYLHPDANTYTFTDADALVNYAGTNGIAVHAHTLIWHSDYQVPVYMKNFSGDKTAFLSMLDEHVKGVATHFAGKVASWDVVNEALADGGGYRMYDPKNLPNSSVFYLKAGGAEYIERAFVAARAADPKALLYYNDYNTEGGDPAKLKSLNDMLDGFKARNVPIDGVGFQMHVYFDWPSVQTISAAFKTVVDRGLKVKISELDIPVNNPYSGSFPGNVVTQYSNDIALKHKKRYCEVVKAYMDTVPPAQRGGVVVWGVDDPSSWLIKQLFNDQYKDWPLLFDKDYHDKPTLRGVADALEGKACTAT
jgi:endo-1,4-beta-xylanase